MGPHQLRCRTNFTVRNRRASQLTAGASPTYVRIRRTFISTWEMAPHLGHASELRPTPSLYEADSLKPPPGVIKNFGHPASRPQGLLAPTLPKAQPSDPPTPTQAESAQPANPVAWGAQLLGASAATPKTPRTTVE